MKFATKPTNTTTSSLRRPGQAGFTLAEVLAALLFMAIVIPVAVKGLQVASRAGEVAVRKAEAMRIAERVMNENLVTTNWSRSTQGGSILDGSRQFRYSLRNEPWPQDASIYAPRLLTAEVSYHVQSQQFFVRLSTLASSVNQ